MVEDIWDKIAGKLLFVFFLILGPLVGFIIFGWQTYTWLRNGYWPKLPFAIALEYLGLNLYSVYNPSDWVGVARVIQWVLSFPLALALPLLIYILAVSLKGFTSAKWE